MKTMICFLRARMGRNRGGAGRSSRFRLEPCFPFVNEHYCSIVIARWEAFTGSKAEKVKGE